MSVESDDQQMDENLSTHSRDETEGLISGVNTPELGSPEKSTTDPPEIADPNVDERYLITLNKPPTKIVKKVMLVTDSNLKKIQVEKEVEEPITLTTTADYRPIPLRQPTLPGSARLKDPTGQAAKKDHSKLAPVKTPKGTLYIVKSSLIQPRMRSACTMFSIPVLEQRRNWTKHTTP